MKGGAAILVKFSSSTGAVLIIRILWHSIRKLAHSILENGWREAKSFGAAGRRLSFPAFFGCEAKSGNWQDKKQSQ